MSDKATLIIQAGVGGRDAEDWAGMLMRMYQRFSQKNNWQFKVLDQSFGPEGGIKSVTCQIVAVGAYQLLKNESGTHRLVRQSPFNAKKLRQTSFALVEILPEIPNLVLEIKPQDLDISFFRASGPGGQYVNKTETAVRISHKPSGLSVACQSERSQMQNRQVALGILKAKLYVQQQKDQRQQLADLKKDFGRPEWGSQIRSYTLHPYKMVKDERTGKKFHNPEDVLDGNLDKLLLP